MNLKRNRDCTGDGPSHPDLSEVVATTLGRDTPTLMPPDPNAGRETGELRPDPALDRLSWPCTACVLFSLPDASPSEIRSWSSASLTVPLSRSAGVRGRWSSTESSVEDRFRSTQRGVGELVV